MGVMSSCSLSQTRLSRSSLPGLDQATGRPLNGTRHRPRAHSHSHTPSLNVLSDWLSHRGAHTAACGPKCYSSRLAARTMITSRVAARNSTSVHWVFRYGPGVEALQHVPSPTSAARATLAPASSPRARRARHESPLQPRAPQPPARPPWPWRATSLLRVPTAHPTSRFTFFGITYSTRTLVCKKRWDSHQPRVGISPPARLGGAMRRCDVNPHPGSLPLGQ